MYKFSVSCLPLNDLEPRGYSAKVMSVSCGATFADDVLKLLAIAPFHLQIMQILYSNFVNIGVSLKYVAKASAIFYTKSRSQPIENIFIKIRHK